MQYKEAEKAILSSEKSTGFQYELSGKLGVRTKFQKTKTAQLVLNVHSNKEDEESAKPNSVALDLDCPLHESPQFDEKNQDVISIEDQIILLA